jgi:hypothetical protein
VLTKINHVQSTTFQTTHFRMMLPVMTYGTETWPLTMGLIRRLNVTKRTIERSMLGISLRDRITNDEIRKRTKSPT